MFGTDLFGSDVEQFKTSTIAASVSTYVLALILIWLADKLGYPQAIFHQAREWLSEAWGKAIVLLRLQRLFPNAAWYSSDSDHSSDSPSESDHAPGRISRVVDRVRAFFPALKGPKQNQARV